MFDAIESNRYIASTARSHRKDFTDECHRRKINIHPSRSLRQPSVPGLRC
jgi:hypothetical protein